jgi:hypothetical protein
VSLGVFVRRFSEVVILEIHLKLFYLYYKLFTIKTIACNIKKQDTNDSKFKEINQKNDLILWQTSNVKPYINILETKLF